MRNLFCIAVLIVLVSCNVSVDKNNGKDSASKFDSTIEKVDDKLEEFGDSAKEKFKDIKTDVKRRLNKDSANEKH